MHLSGQLSDWSINDLLQIMQVTNKTGSLDIDGERKGRIHFRDGAVTGAELKGGRGTETGEDRGGVADILFVLSSLTSGSFSVGPADGPDTEGWSVEDVLGEVEGLQSLEEEVGEAGLREAAAVRLVPEIEEEIRVSPADWTTLVALVQPFTFGQLEEDMGRGGAVRLLHALHRLDLAEAAAADEDESGWLDRLAEDVTPESTEPNWFEPLQSEEPVAEEAAPPVPVEPLAEPEAGEPEPIVPLMLADPTDPEDVHGVSAPASTTLTDGVYDEIRRLRSKVADK